MIRISMQELRDKKVSRKSMTMWWLGQAGFIIKSPAGKIVALDPYLSNSCKRLGEELGFNMDRLVPSPFSPAELAGIDLYIITHSHQDHLDPETINGYRAAGGEGPYLAPAEACERLRQMNIPDDQLVMAWPNKRFMVGDIALQATFAIPLGSDDLTHVGYLVFIDDGPTAYFSGDTAYHELIATTVAEHKPDIIVPVINGTFSNMTPADAARLAKIVNPRLVIPCHYDLFPDNAMRPELLKTNLHMLDIGDKYMPLEQGRPFTYSK